MVEVGVLDRKDRSLAELGERISQFGPGLPDQLPLTDLFGWQRGKGKTSCGVPEWDKLRGEINPIETAKITKALGVALRVGIGTLGELRSMEESQLAILVPMGVKIPIGQETARFLKMSFSEPANGLVLG